MKRSLKPLFFSLILLCFMAFAQISMAQPPPPTDQGTGTNQGPGGLGAPIDGGLTILLALGLGYGGRKIYFLRKKKVVNS